MKTASKILCTGAVLLMATGLLGGCVYPAPAPGYYGYYGPPPATVVVGGGGGVGGGGCGGGGGGGGGGWRR